MSNKGVQGGRGASRLLHSVPCEPMDSELVACLGQIRVTSFFQVITLHFSSPVQRRNHRCRSREPKSLLAVRCLGAKFYCSLSSLHHTNLRHVNPTLLLLHKMGPASPHAGAGRTEPSPSVSPVPSDYRSHFHWCLHQVSCCHLPLLKLPTSIHQLRHFHLLQCLTGTNASIYIAGALLREEYAEP